MQLFTWKFCLVMFVVTGPLRYLTSHYIMTSDIASRCCWLTLYLYLAVFIVMEFWTSQLVITNHIEKMVIIKWRVVKKLILCTLCTWPFFIASHLHSSSPPFPLLQTYLHTCMVLRNFKISLEKETGKCQFKLWNGQFFFISSKTISCYILSYKQCCHHARLNLL